MRGYYLNFSNLNEEAQNQLICDAESDYLETIGEEELRQEAENMNIDFESLLRERAERHMYNFDFIFNV